jgi:hypothetical protein
MKCQKISEIRYLRTFEAAEALKSYRAPLWTESYKALGAMALGVFFGTTGITWSATSTELKIFDHIKNISFYKRLEISPRTIETLSTVVPLCIGLIAAVSAIVFQINKTDQNYHWENHATMFLQKIDPHILLNKSQVYQLLAGSPLDYRSALNQYTVLGKSLADQNNAVEKAALEQLYDFILVKAHMNKVKAYDAALKQCKVIVNDQRVIEHYLKNRLNPEILKPIKLFAEHAKLENLKLACS